MPATSQHRTLVAMQLHQQSVASGRAQTSQRRSAQPHLLLAQAAPQSRAVSACPHLDPSASSHQSAFLSSAVRPSQRGIRLSRVAAHATAAKQDAYDVVIVGGGLSGLVAGQALAAKHGVSNFLVTEGRERVGGNITSSRWISGLRMG